MRQFRTVIRVLDEMREKLWKGTGQCVNEVLSFKLHILLGVLQQLGDWLIESKDKKKKSAEETAALEELRRRPDGDLTTRIASYTKFLLKGCDPDGVPEMQERLLRQLMKEYPWLESELFQQTLRHIASQTVVS